MSRWLRTLVVAVVAAGAVGSMSVGGALLTTRTVVHDNGFDTRPDAEQGIGVYNPLVAPFTGTSFAEDGLGMFTFRTYQGSVPSPLPEVRAGDRVQIVIELPMSLKSNIQAVPGTHSRGFDWCVAPPSGALTYMAIDCNVTEHANGSSALALNLTATRTWVSRTWASMGSIGVGVHGASSLPTGEDSLMTTIRLPRGGADTKSRTLRAGFTTLAGPTSTLGVHQASVTTHAGSSNWVYGDEGAAVWNLAPASDPRALRVKTGERVVYDLSFGVFDVTGSLAYNDDPVRPVRDTCKEPIPGWSVTCDARLERYHYIVTVTLERTGADSSTEFGSGLEFSIPLEKSHRFSSTAGNSTIRLMEAPVQSGSAFPVRTPVITYNEGSPRPDVGVHNAVATPSTGDTFTPEDDGDLSFSFMDDAASAMSNQMPRVLEGEQISVDVELPSVLIPGHRDTDSCDVFGFPANLFSVDCSDEKGGGVHVVATALQDIPAEFWEQQVRIPVHRSADANHDDASPTAIIRLSVPDGADADEHTSEANVDIPMADPEAPAPGIWDVAASPESGNGTWAEGDTGFLTWSLYAAGADDFLKTGETVTYSLSVPNGLSVAVDDCDQGTAGWAVRCAENDGRVVVTLERTASDESFDGTVRIPLSASVENSGEGELRIELTEVNGTRVDDPISAVVPVRFASTVAPIDGIDDDDVIPAPQTDEAAAAVGTVDAIHSGAARLLASAAQRSTRNGWQLEYGM